jgi:hypothetical protein
MIETEMVWCVVYKWERNGGAGQREEEREERGEQQLFKGFFGGKMLSSSVFPPMCVCYSNIPRDFNVV